MALFYIAVKIGENKIEIQEENNNFRNQKLNNGIITIRAFFFLILKVI